MKIEMKIFCNLLSLFQGNLDAALYMILIFKISSPEMLET